MGWVSARGIGPDQVLLTGACIYYCTASSFERIRGSRDDWLDIWCEEAHDKECDLFADSFDRLLQAWNLGDEACKY